MPPGFRAFSLPVRITSLTYDESDFISFLFCWKGSRNSINLVDKLSLQATQPKVPFRQSFSISGISSALNYGESQGAESRKDFIHKLRIVLKELRETLVALKIVQRTNIVSDSDRISNLMAENIELISIFVRSIKTTRLNELSHTSKF